MYTIGNVGIIIVALTSNTSILRMITVMNPNTIIGAVIQVCLGTSALHIIKPYDASPLPKVCRSVCSWSTIAVAQLFAHHIRIS